MKPNENWKKESARFAIYFYGNGDTWVDMYKLNDDLYYAVSPTDKSYTNLIFARMKPGETENKWDNRWNQTDNLTYDGTNNHYEIAPDAWNEGGGTWSATGDWGPSNIFLLFSALFRDTQINILIYSVI